MLPVNTVCCTSAIRVGNLIITQNTGFPFCLWQHVHLLSDTGTEQHWDHIHPLYLQIYCSSVTQRQICFIVTGPQLHAVGLNEKYGSQQSLPKL